MDIRPYFVGPTGQANVQATPGLQAHWSPFKVRSGLLISRPFQRVALGWQDRPEIEGGLSEEEAPAGVPDLQVE